MTADDQLRRAIQHDIDRYQTPAVPASEIESTIRTQRRLRAGGVGIAVTATLVAIGAGYAWVAPNQADPDDAPATSAGQRCLHSVQQNYTRQSAEKFNATVTRSNCSTYTVQGSQTGLNSVAVWPTGSDNTTVLIERDGDKSSSVSLYDQDTGTTEVVFERDSIIDEATLSPDGTHIAIVANAIPQDGYGHILILDLDTGKVTPAPETLYSSRPDWSPDGTKLAYVTGAGPQGDQPTDTRVAILGVATNDITTPRFPDGGLNNPTWSPDGTKLAATVTTTGETDTRTSIAVHDTTTGTLTQTPDRVIDQLWSTSIDLGWTTEGLTLISLDHETREVQKTGISSDLATVTSTNPGEETQRVW